MQSEVVDLGDSKVRVTVALDPKEFDKEVEAAYKRMAKEARVPGFRPGKAPRVVLENYLGKGAGRKEALRTAVPDAYSKAVSENEVDVIAQPTLEITEGEEEGQVKFEAVVEVRPQIKLDNYKGLRVTVPAPNATAEEIDEQLTRMRGQFAELKTVERPAQNNDNVTIDLHTSSKDGEEVDGLSADDFLYEVGSDGVVPELDQQLVGAKAGDILTFDATLPNATEQLSFRVLVKEVKEKLLPELNDEWAADASEFKTVDELKADLDKRISAVKQVQSQIAYREATLDELAKLVTIELPEALIDLEMRRFLQDMMYRLQAQGASLPQYLQATGQTEEQLTADLKERAKEAAQSDLALRAVAEDLGLSPTEEELDEEIGKLAEQMGRKTPELRRELERLDQLISLRSDLRKAKALEWLLENVEVVDENGQPVDREILTKQASLDELDHSGHNHSEDE